VTIPTWAPGNGSGRRCCGDAVWFHRRLPLAGTLDRRVGNSNPSARRRARLGCNRGNEVAILRSHSVAKVDADRVSGNLLTLRNRYRRLNVTVLPNAYRLRSAHISNRNLMRCVCDRQHQQIDTGIAQQPLGLNSRQP